MTDWYVNVLGAGKVRQLELYNGKGYTTNICLVLRHNKVGLVYVGLLVSSPYV